MRLEAAIEMHVTETDLSRRRAVLEDKLRNVFRLNSKLHAELLHKILHQCVATQLVRLGVRNFGMVPKSTHLAKNRFRDQLYLDFGLLLDFLPTPLLCQTHLPIASLYHLWVHGLRIWRRQHLSTQVLPNVHQHIRIVNARLRVDQATQLMGAPLKIIPNSKITASIIVFDGSELATRCDRLIIELEPSSPWTGLDVRIVVPAVHISIVDNYSEQVIASCILRKGAEVQLPREFEPGVELDHVHLVQVKVEALQLQIQNGRKPQETNSLLCTLLAIAFCLVGVLSFESFLCREIMQRIHNVLHLLPEFTFDVQLNVIECLIAPRLVVHVNALYVVLHFTFKKPLNRSIGRCILHSLLQSIAKDPVQLLCIVLGESIHCIPSERLHQLFAVDGQIRRLHFVENILQGMNQLRRSLKVVAFISSASILCILRVRILALNGVHNPAELPNVEQTLQQPIHVAGCTMILQAGEPGLLFAAVIIR
mmetsp:Transcript_10917/g.26225  ORF Transcript_10917/g.26225 Transcript_10917/m.26225 type:complete len:480 (-) Transcript_10917:830-2269(-)